MDDRDPENVEKSPPALWKKGLAFAFMASMIFWKAVTIGTSPFAAALWVLGLLAFLAAASFVHRYAWPA